MPESAMTYEETLTELQSWLGRRVMAFVGGASSDPAVVAYCSGTLANAVPDPIFDALLQQAGHSGGEALHFRLVDDVGDQRLVLVIFEDLFFQTLRTEQGVLHITQRDPYNPEGGGVAISIRPEA